MLPCVSPPWSWLTVYIAMALWWEASELVNRSPFRSDINTIAIVNHDCDRVELRYKEKNIITSLSHCCNFVHIPIMTRIVIFA